jgi:MFS family permease
MEKPMGETAAPPPRGTRLGQTFAAMRYRNFRLWFFGQLFSLFGTWMQSTAQQYLVFQLTNSEAFLGYVAFAQGIASLAFMLYAGVIADRVSRRNMMLVTQSAMLVLAFALALLTGLGVVQPWHILVFSFLLGVANAFDTPARQAFVLEMVRREDLTNAIALSGTMFNLSQVVGPALGGILYAVVGPAWCFAFNGFSFITVIGALLLMRDLHPVPQRPRGGSALKELGEAWRYVVSQPVVRTIFVTVGTVTLLGISFATLLPAWADEVLHGNAETFGYLSAARAAGAVVSALLLAAVSHVKFKGRLWTLGTFLFPPLLLIFAFVRSLTPSLLLLAGVGAGTVFIFNLSNTFVQTLTPDALRGRVMGLYGLVFFGMMAAGGLLAGGVAQLFGPTVLVVAGSTLCLALAVLLYLFAPRLRALE